MCIEHNFNGKLVATIGDLKGILGADLLFLPGEAADAASIRTDIHCLCGVDVWRMAALQDWREIDPPDDCIFGAYFIKEGA